MEKHAENWDYLIVGQGIAGTLLAYFMLKSGLRICVIDKPHRAASSLKAAGIINPITGRRYAKSWLIETLIPFAKKTYKALEHDLGILIWNERNLLRALPTVQDENEWLRRSAFPDFAPWFAKEADLSGFEKILNPVRAWGETVGSAQVNFPALIAAFRDKLRQENALREEEFRFDRLKWRDEFPVYDGRKVKGVIFCEGARAVANPYFNYLPFVPTKGEYLEVKIPESNFPKMVKNGVTIVPMGEGSYWVGATSRFEYDDDLPTARQKEWLLSKLRKALAIPFEVIKHDAAIRPTVFGTRPFLGRHPEHTGLYIFNGLGTKGASLAPFFARHFTAHLLDDAPLMKEVDIARFADKYTGSTPPAR